MVGQTIIIQLDFEGIRDLRCLKGILRASRIEGVSLQTFVKEALISEASSVLTEFTSTTPSHIFYDRQLKDGDEL